MMHYSKTQFYLFCLLLITVLSCKDKDPKADCGCGGPTIMVVKDASASYLGNGNLLLRRTNENKQLYEIYVDACSIADTLKITPDIKNPDYIVSGNIKKECFNGPTLVAVAPKFEVMQIKRGL